MQQQVLQASSDDREADPNDDAMTAGWKEGKNDYLNGDAYDILAHQVRQTPIVVCINWVMSKDGMHKVA